MSSEAVCVRATAPAAPATTRCQNCGNAVTQRYCGGCGQRLDSPLHSLWHFTQLAWYMYRSMRNVYGQGWALTLAKLSLCYLFIGALTIGITTAYSALSL
jgi:hypothetical protein